MGTYTRKSGIPKVLELSGPAELDQLSLFKVINASFLEDDATFLPCKMYQSEFLSKSKIHRAGHQEGKSGTIRQWLRLQYTEFLFLRSLSWL